MTHLFFLEGAELHLLADLAGVELTQEPDLAVAGLTHDPEALEEHSGAQGDVHPVHRRLPGPPSLVEAPDPVATHGVHLHLPAREPLLAGAHRGLVGVPDLRLRQDLPKEAQGVLGQNGDGPGSLYSPLDIAPHMLVAGALSSHTPLHRFIWSFPKVDTQGPRVHHDRGQT